MLYDFYNQAIVNNAVWFLMRLCKQRMLEVLCILGIS